MGLLRIQDFGGVVPVKGDRSIPDGYAVESVNTWLYGSELRGVRPPIFMQNFLSTTRKLLRIPKRTLGGDPTYPDVVPPPSFLGDSVWKQFDDPDTDIVRGSLVKDIYERYYFCSPSRGPEFNTYARMEAGLGNYKLGVPGPNIDIVPGAVPPADNADRPIIGTPTGGTGTNETRSYVYTWINEFGEESHPSLPATASGLPNATWPISNIKDPPVVAGYPAYSKKRLYRTVTGSSGGFDYYKVSDIAIGTTTFSDNGAVYSNTTIVNNVTLESTSWALPPANLQGWIAMPNGFLIGFDKPDPVTNAGGNTIYMSEAYRFHAWPEAYQYATETPIVGLGVLGQTCVVCTQGYPATITGIKPATCAFTKATTGEPCLSRGGIVSTPSGIVYPSQNGLQMVGPNGIQNVVEPLMTREEWTRDYAPQYLRAVRYQNGYLALRMPPLPSPRSGFFLDPSSLKVALTEFSDLGDIRNFNSDFWSGEVFLLQTGINLLHWDPPFKADGSKNNDLMPVRWKSKEFQYPFEENFGCYALYWDDARYSNNPWGDPTVMPVDEKVRFRVYANRILRYDEEVPRNGRPVRLPSGFKTDIWQFEILARAPVYTLHVASTMKELKNA